MTLRQLEEELLKYQEIEKKYDELEEIENDINMFDEEDVLEIVFLEEQRDYILEALEGYEDCGEILRKIEELKEKIENIKKLRKLPFMKK